MTKAKNEKEMRHDRSQILDHYGTYPNFPVEPKIVLDIKSSATLSRENPLGISATCTNVDSYPPDISLDSIPAALFERGFAHE